MSVGKMHFQVPFLKRIQITTKGKRLSVTLNVPKALYFCPFYNILFLPLQWHTHYVHFSQILFPARYSVGISFIDIPKSYSYFSASSSNCPALHSRNLHLSSLNSISCFSEQKKDTNIAVFHHPCQPDLYICFYKVNCRIIPIFFINSVIVSIKV